MLSREQFASVVNGLNTIRQEYKTTPMPMPGMTVNLIVRRWLKTDAGRAFDSATLQVRGPVASFVSLGGILWGVAVSMGCSIKASAYDGLGTWELCATGEPQSPEGEEVLP